MKNNVLAAIFLSVLLWPGICFAAGDAPKDEAVSYTPLPKGLASSYLSGQFARSSGDIDQAVHYLARVHKDDPENLSVARQLQGMLLLQGKVEESFELAKDIALLDSKDQLSGLLLSLRDIKNSKYQLAMQKIDAVVPETGGVQLWQPLISGWLDVALHHMKKPLAIESLSADITRATPLVNYHLAILHDFAGFKQAAALNYKNAIDDPKNPPLRIMKMLLKFYRENGEPDILTPLVNQYQEAFPEEDNLKDIPQIATVQDGVAEILYTMGGVMLGAGVTNDAAIYLQLALYEKPEFHEAALGLGDAYAELEQYTMSNVSYGRIPAGSRLYNKGQLRIAANYDRMGNLDEALTLLDQIGAASPDEWDALVMRGDLLRIHARYGEAIAAYTQAISRIPKLETRQWPILFARASCLERQGKWDEAEKDLRQALALKPDQPDILNYLGYGWLEHGQNLAEARELIERAVKARPNDAQIVDSMGWALYLSGDYEKATEYLEKAVELLPGDPSVNDHLGDVYWRLGRKTEARFQWERALSFSPNEKMAEAISRKLKEGLPPTTLATSAPAADAAN